MLKTTLLLRYQGRQCRYQRNFIQAPCRIRLLSSAADHDDDGNGGDGDNDEQLSNQSVVAEYPIFPLQTKEVSDRLYDTIAPHLEYKAIRGVANKLKGIKIKENFPTVVRQVDISFNFTRKTMTNAWLQPLLTDFLSGLDVYNHNADYLNLQNSDAQFGEVRTATKHNLSEHLQFPPSINRENFEANVKLLMDARISAIEQKRPLYFSEGTARRHNKNDPFIPEEDIAAFHSKTEEKKQEEAEEIADLLADRLPKRLHDRVYQFIDTYFVRRKIYKKHYYYSNMKGSCNFHTHLVLKELAEFLYIPLPKFIDESFLAEGWRDWNAIRDEMSIVFFQAQRKFALSYRAAAADHSDKKQVAGVASVLQISQELDIIRSQAGGKSQERERHVNQGIAPTKAHVEYNAVLLSREGLAGIEEKYKQETRRQLYIDNLPIDIDEEELIDIYSRCGDIESVRIFNRRPDLDPGNPKIEVKERMSRGMMMEKTTRTPIYAIVKFATDEGHSTATSVDLRVFGIIVQRHAVRSIRKEEMKSLYIENIPRGFYALDIEYKLCKVLDPYFYVCSGTGGHDLAEPSSCKITFPSHEAASFAYDKLVQIDMGSDDCVMNWMRTPRDAMNYWTRRKLGAAK